MGETFFKTFVMWTFQFKFESRWIPRLIAQLEKKLFGIPDFFIAFGSPIGANTFSIFGFGRGPPRWAWQPLKVLQFFKIGWRCGTLEDYISGSGWPIWARVCLLEKSDSLLLGKKYEIWNLPSSPDLGSRAIFGTLYLSWATWHRVGLIVALTTHYGTFKNAHQKYSFRVFAKIIFFLIFEPFKFLKNDYFYTFFICFDTNGPYSNSGWKRKSQKVNFTGRERP
jgi:hypothetical protein